MQLSFIRDDRREQNSIDKLKVKDEKKITLQMHQNNVQFFQKTFEKNPQHIKHPIPRDHKRNPGMR